MSEQLPPPGEPPYDAKAQAAAAKAYAKAQRPWYKKKRWIAAMVIGALVVIGIATSSGGDKGSQKDTASDSPTATVTNSQTEGPGATSPAADETPDNSSATKDGAITWGNWEVVGKIQVKKEDYTDDFDVITRVRNTGKDPDEGIFTVTMLKNDEILGTATCSTSTVQPGAVGTADCGSLDKFKPGWTEITIEDAF